MLPLSKLDNQPQSRQSNMKLQEAKTNQRYTFSGRIGFDEPASSQKNKAVSAEDIQAWLISKLSEELELDFDEIDIYEPFARYGLTSITAVSLSGDLQDWLQIKLSPTLTWDYPTIEALAQHLERELHVSVSKSQSRVSVNGGAVVKWSL